VHPIVDDADNFLVEANEGNTFVVLNIGVLVLDDEVGVFGDVGDDVVVVLVEVMVILVVE